MEPPPYYFTYIYLHMKPLLKPELKIVVVCLHGQNDREGRQSSLMAFQHYKLLHSLGTLDGVSVMSYVDSYGYPVFCAAMFVTPDYVPGTYVASWEFTCKEFGISPATSYEQMFDFQDMIFGNYSLRE